MSFVTKKSDLNQVKVLGYPNKLIGVFIKQSIIFRYDSNGEDLDGYIGDGLYDSVPIVEEERPTETHKQNLNRPHNNNDSVNMNSSEAAQEADERSNNVSNFECNICLKMAREPVVTSCGHLFCWSCLY